MHQFSSDGYLHLPESTLARMPLKHLLSGMDEELVGTARRCGGVTTLSGYTEWVSPSEPALSIGWDWLASSSAGGVVRLGLPRTNVLLVSDAEVPLPWEESLEVLARFIDAIAWQKPALQAACEGTLTA